MGPVMKIAVAEDEWNVDIKVLLNKLPLCVAVPHVGGLLEEGPLLRIEYIFKPGY